MTNLDYKEIRDMSRAEINRHFRAYDDSHLWPICGRFNATERAIRKVQKFERETGEKLSALPYYLTLERYIQEIVNDPKL